MLVPQDYATSLLGGRDDWRNVDSVGEIILKWISVTFCMRMLTG